MSLFGRREKLEISKLRRENQGLKKQNIELKRLCHEKDSHFRELMSDDLRHGGSLGGKHMADWREYKKHH